MSIYLNLASGVSIVLIEALFFVVALVVGPRSGASGSARGAD